MTRRARRTPRSLRSFARARADWLASGRGTEPRSRKWSVIFEITSDDAGERTTRSIVQVAERGAAFRGLRPHDRVVRAVGSAAFDEAER